MKATGILWKNLPGQKLQEGHSGRKLMRLSIRNFLLDPQTGEEAELAAGKLFTYRLYCDDKKIRRVIVCHSQMKKEEVYPCIQGVAYPRIYTDDAVILFEDENQRRYMSTVHYNLKSLQTTVRLLRNF